MSERDEKTDEAIEQINNTVEDGGGCTEAWEAVSDMRQGDRSEIDAGRRSAIKTVLAVAGVGIGGSQVLTGSAAANGETHPHVDVQEVAVVTGGAKTKIVDKAIDSSEFERLQRWLVDRNFSQTTIQAYQSVTAGGSFHTVDARYTKGKKVASILWTDWDPIQTNGIVQSSDTVYSITLPQEPSTTYTQSDVEVSPQVSLPDIPGCPGTDYKCLRLTIIANGIPSIACTACLADIATGNDTGACERCLNALNPLPSIPCTICTGR